jgi:hypothetical protein
MDADVPKKRTLDKDEKQTATPQYNPYVTSVEDDEDLPF